MMMMRRRRRGERTLKVKNRHARRGFAKGTVGMTEEGVWGKSIPQRLGSPLWGLHGRG